MIVEHDFTRIVEQIQAETKTSGARQKEGSEAATLSTRSAVCAATAAVKADPDLGNRALTRMAYAPAVVSTHTLAAKPVFRGAESTHGRGHHTGR